MISVKEALEFVLENQKDFGTEEVSLLTSTGRILAEPVYADRDFPPYNRVMMDGIAIKAATFTTAYRSFEIEKIQAAGGAQQTLEDDKKCIEVMTGAVLPENTDAVIPYEQCGIEDRKATVLANQVARMQNVHAKGTDSKKGEVLAEKWQRITPAMVGIMASVGLAFVPVLRRPAIAICSTGDELVSITEEPLPHQVRRSNVYMLAAALLAEGIEAATLHLPDEPAAMTAQIADLIQTNDVILFSGAVSKGKFDYLPAVLQQLGIQLIFHQVAQRPGKPFLFGKFANGTLVFGFPGNPVSTFVCYHQFFKRWLHTSLHYAPIGRFAKLAADVTFKPALTCHLLVNVINDNGSLLATAVSGSSSGDLVTLTKANGILVLPPDRDYFEKGESFDFNLLD